MKRIKINKDQYHRLGSVILKEEQIKLPRKFEEIPGGQDNYRTNQPSLEQLEYIIKHYDIKNVIRMNGEEGTGVTPQSEEREVEKLGANYYFINAHDGFEKGEGYLTSMDEALPILEEGHTLIHCTGGRDRTGYIVAEYLQRNFNWDKDKLWEYTVAFNNWEDHICNNTGNKGYIKYMEGFYPLDEWCENYDPNNKCPNCSDVIVVDIPEDNEWEDISPTGEKITDFDEDLDGKLIKRYGGNNKEDVEKIQIMLHILGYNIGNYGKNKDGIDGRFGPVTRRGVIDFQKDVFPTNPLEWDGIVGPKTYEKLIEEIDKVAAQEGVDREELLISFDPTADEQGDIDQEEVEIEDKEEVYDIPDIPKGKLSRSQYIDLWKNIAIDQMRHYNIPASITLAQGIIESGDGNSRLARKGNNHFGIKCHRDWQGDTIIATDDRPDECFRKYPTAMGSFEDHSKFLHKHGRYDFLFDLDITDYEGWARGLKKAGYATSPTYADTLINVIERNNLSQYDKVA